MRTESTISSGRMRLEPGGTFLAGCPFFASLAGGGLARVGYFWRDVLEWDLVWDKDAEISIQSSTGGLKLTWGGEPVQSKWRAGIELPTPS